MSFTNLNAQQLAEIDAICIEFEQRLRNGESIEPSDFASRYDGPAGEALLEELRLIDSEIRGTGSGAFGTRSFSSSRSSGRLPEPTLEQGTRLGPYVVREMIGAGGMGQVFRGHDDRLDRSVAIKVLATEAAEKPDRLDRFHREAKTIAALKHPGIVSIFDVGTHHGRPYAVMELLEGETVRDWMSGQSHSPEEIRWLATEAVEALEVAHDTGVIHRDLKPENMLITRDGKLKILDFGLSRILQGEDAATSSPTETGVIMGTLGYLSPEQARGKEVSGQSDIFSLGCVLYELFYERRPFPGSTPSEAIAAIVNDTPARRDTQRDLKDPQLAEIIHRCISKDLRLRYQAAAQLREDLRPETVVQGDRRMWLRYAGGALVGAGTILGYRFVSDRLQVMKGIHSIAIMPLQVSGNGSPDNRPPQMLSRGEELAALISHRLMDSGDVEVRPFHAVVALKTRDVQQVAKDLDVDAVISGTITPGEQQQIVRLDITPRNPATSAQRETFRLSNDNSLIEVSQRAKRIARVIGRELAIHNPETQNQMAYRCFVDGDARLDPSNVLGIKQSVMCFEDAVARDELFAEAYAGWALANCLLLQQNQPKIDIKRIIQQATRAIELESDSARAHLSLAILAWQIDGDFPKAQSHFEMALKRHPNDWQVHYQFAYFLACAGDNPRAIGHAQRALRLDPTSPSSQLCVARTQWFAGETMNALDSSLAILLQWPENRDARGLAIDILEQEGHCQLATQLLQREALPSKQRIEELMKLECQPDLIKQYHELRVAQIKDLPYGDDYGPALNQLILDLRRGEKISDLDLRSRFQSTTTPWMMLLASTHPALTPVKKHDYITGLRLKTL